MKFDVIIIGGGLAGLSCGIRLAEAGKRCAIVSAGQNALHFSSGSLDLLSTLPDGSAVASPLTALEALTQQAPEHPYSLLGAQKVSYLAQQAEMLLQRCGLHLTGNAQHNHLRMTSLGLLRPTWLSLPEIPVVPYGDSLHWHAPLIASIEGFMDFQPQLVAASLQQQGINARITYLRLPLLDPIRRNSSEFRSVTIARLLDQEDNYHLLVEELRQQAAQHDVILLPACFGLQRADALSLIQQALGKPVLLLPTLPPSILGTRLSQHLEHYFQQLGGLVLMGDSVLQSETMAEGGWRLYTRNHTDIALQAQQVVLASGSFFSNGLVADRHCIREPLFNLDVLAADKREQWTRAGMFEPQPYLQFGVRTDSQLRALRQGEVLPDLYVAGAVLGGFDPLYQGCGAGVSLLTALAIAEQILA
ncbi:MAG: glycerol-3-phosphate dehydrogenase subunit GlpB [Enterobacteriaceae bacterium]